MSQDDSDTGSVDLEAARVALLVLRASVLGTARPEQNRVVIMPAAEILTISQTVDYLARIQKPVACVADTAAVGIALHCTSVVQDGKDARLHGVFVGMLGGASGLGRVVMNHSRGIGAVKIVGAQESLLASGFGFERWYHDYALPRNVGLGGRPPTVEEHAGGVTFVVTVGRGQEMPVDTAAVLDTL